MAIVLVALPEKGRKHVFIGNKKTYDIAGIIAQLLFLPCPIGLDISRMRPTKQRFI
jgi:hypothetical protein